MILDVNKIQEGECLKRFHKAHELYACRPARSSRDGVAIQSAWGEAAVRGMLSRHTILPERNCIFLFS
jgi:hypothetical protein